MTTLLLNAGDPNWIIPGGGSLVKIYGSVGIDSLTLSQGAQVQFDASFNAGNDSLTLEGDASDFTISRSGTTVTLSDSQGTQIVIPAGTSGQELIFGDGSLELGIDSGKVMIGDQEITSTDTNITGSTGGGSTGNYTVVSVDQGILDTPASLNASGDSFKFTDNASVTGNVDISNFTNDDVIELPADSTGDYNFSNNGEDVIITYNNAGIMNIITLTGVVDNSDLIYNETSFESAIGFDAVIYA